MMERHLTFIRHGHGINNLDKRVFYTLPRREMYDCKLTGEGEKQCNALKDILKIDFHKIYVSSLERTLQTANILFCDSNCDISVTDLVREYKNNISSYRKPISEKKEKYPYMDFSMIKSNHDDLKPEFDTYAKRLCFFKYKKKEAIDFMMDRVKEFLDEIALTNYKKICIISHRGFIHMFGRFYDKYIDIKNCGVYNMKVYM